MRLAHVAGLPREVRVGRAGSCTRGCSASGACHGEMSLRLLCSAAVERERLLAHDPARHWPRDRTATKVPSASPGQDLYRSSRRRASCRCRSDWMTTKATEPVTALGAAAGSLAPASPARVLSLGVPAVSVVAAAVVLLFPALVGEPRGGLQLAVELARQRSLDGEVGDQADRGAADREQRDQPGYQPAAQGAGQRDTGPQLRTPSDLSTAPGISPPASARTRRRGRCGSAAPGRRRSSCAGS